MGRLGGVGRRNSASSSSAAAAAAVAGVGSTLAGGGSGGGGGSSGYGDADVAKLKDAIQTLCQSTHPLGECIRPGFVLFF